MVVASTAYTGECGGTGMCVDTHAGAALAEQFAANYQGAQLGCVIHLRFVDGCMRSTSWLECGGDGHHDVIYDACGRTIVLYLCSSAAVAGVYQLCGSGLPDDGVASDGVAAAFQSDGDDDTFAHLVGTCASGIVSGIVAPL